MRIDRLDLTAFGPFTDRTLDLSAAGIQVIHGPNEAGKSTALYALGQLLYGIDLQSPYDFVHPKPSLRLGARLRSHDGKTLEIVRTKSRKAPLRRPDGTQLPEAELLSLLGGVDRHTFVTVFALNSAELRQGGRALVSGGGDLGQALAASRSGLSLTNAHKKIEARIGDLYKRAASKPRINAQINTLKEARERKRTALLRPERYETLEKEAASAQRELDRLTRELAEARGAHTRLTRLRQALPALRRCRDLLAQIEAVSGRGVLAPVETAERHPALLNELGGARDRLAAAENGLDRAREELAALVVDDDLLAHADTIEDLFQDRKAVQDAALRLGRSEGEAKRLAEEAQRLLHQVHPDATVEDTARYRVPKAVRSRVQTLHDRRTVIDTGLEQSRRALETRRRKLEEAEKALSELPQAEDPEPLRAAVAAVPADLLTLLATADEDGRKHRRRAEQILLDLRLPELPVEAAATVTTPSRERLDAHAGARAELRRDQRDLGGRTRAAEKELADLRLELDALLRGDPPPTEEELTAARAARDELWRAIRAPGAGDAARAEELHEAFEEAMGRADRMADRMRRDAQRVTARHHLELDIRKAEQELDRLGGDREALDARAAELEAEWTGLWEGFAGPAPDPGDAGAVADDARRLREALEEIAEAGGRFAAQHARAVRHVRRLREVLRLPDPSAGAETRGDAEAADTDLLGGPGLLGDVEEALPGVGADDVLAELPHLMEIAQQRLAEQQTAAQERTAQEKRVEVERAELAEAAAIVAGHEADLADWAGEWGPALAQAGLPADRDTVGALTDLELLEQAADKVAEASRTGHESEQDTARVERFHALLRTTALACGRTVPADEAERYLLVDRLHADAKANRSAAEARDSLTAGRDRLRADADAARAAVERAEAELAALVTAAGAADADELRDAVRRREEHNRLTATFGEVRDTISAEGEDLTGLLARAEETGPDRLEAELAELAARVADLETRRDEQATRLGEQKAELARLDGSATAAQAAADVETAAAALVEDTEEYLRLEIARTVLRRQMEEFRDAQQDPVLARAGGLFAELTLGRFTGLELDPDGDSPTVLAGSAARGPLRVEQLSEATADQLYLALRLATLERYAEEGRALPFAVDDIFMTFDDRRAQAALRVLDGMAGRFQMIVFTHHDHLVDLARAALPTGRVHLHSLPEFSAPPAPPLA
ncbi:AAA family ATPase [Sphaerimonospora sp. CA-214678]|uniref:AAA family ATPase n=1 Tax=Sphaerimonospora sp. CA-214678 TaxID=3240029 RepID=UPI003D8E53AE